MKQSLIIVAFFLCGATMLHAQEKADDKPKPRKVSEIIRENENLKRENAALKHDLEVRDSYIQLDAQRYDARSQQLQMVLAKLIPSDDETKRCAAIEAELREAEKPDKEQAFDCKAMTFAEKKKQ